MSKTFFSFFPKIIEDLTENLQMPFDIVQTINTCPANLQSILVLQLFKVIETCHKLVCSSGYDSSYIV